MEHKFNREGSIVLERDYWDNLFRNSEGVNYDSFTMKEIEVLKPLFNRYPGKEKYLIKAIVTSFDKRDFSENTLLEKAENIEKVEKEKAEKEAMEMEARAQEIEVLNSRLREIANKFPVEMGKLVQFLDYKKRNWCEHSDAPKFMALLPDEVKNLMDEAGSERFLGIVSMELLMDNGWGLLEEFKLKVEG